jgi:hypothetical protein
VEAAIEPAIEGAARWVIRTRHSDIVKLVLDPVSGSRVRGLPTVSAVQPYTALRVGLPRECFDIAVGDPDDDALDRFVVWHYCYDVVIVFDDEHEFRRRSRTSRQYRHGVVSARSRPRSLSGSWPRPVGR